jgi:D-alanine-D-alanine ligase
VKKEPVSTSHKIHPDFKPLSPGRRLSVVILYYAGTKDDDEDTLSCVRGVEESLTRLGHTVTKVVVTGDNWQHAVKTPGDVIFNFVEDDTWVLYMNVLRSLEKDGRAQVGHDIKGIRYVTDKSAIKERMEQAGISTPGSRTLSSQEEAGEADILRYPLIVKPSQQHAGIGISQASVVKTREELTAQLARVFSQYPGDAVVEEFIKGREIHVTVAGNGSDLMIFPFCEIGYGGKYGDSWNIYSYEAKWDKKSWQYWDARVQAPAQVSSELARRISEQVQKAFTAFECRDVARFDIRIDDRENPYVVDVNMNPSLNYYDEEDATVASVYAFGWTYDQFIETILAVTFARVFGSRSAPDLTLRTSASENTVLPQ